MSAAIAKGADGLPIPFDLGYENPSYSEIAEAVGVPLRELDQWLLDHKEFSSELSRGMETWGKDASRDVAEALLKAGTGYEGERMVKQKDGSLKRVEEFMQPNPKAMEKFLEVWNPDKYKEKKVDPKRKVPLVAIRISQDRLAEFGEVQHTEILVSGDE